MDRVPERSESVDTRQLHRKRMIHLILIAGIVLTCIVNIWIGVGDQVYWRTMMKSAVTSAMNETVQQ